MSETQTLNDRIQALLLMTVDDEEAIITTLDKLVKDFGVNEVQQWCVPQSRHKNLLIHEFVRLGLLKTIDHAANELGFNINVKRESDGNTPLHLVYWYRKSNIGELLKKLQADVTIENNYGESANDLERARESMMNIIWLDTELTSLDDPHILECGVLVTDKNLNELERGHWIIHYEKEELEKLSEFHQKTFKSRTDGGNGLFDDVLASKTTKEEMESQLLELIKRHCPEKSCPLAGSSIHVDREVVRLRMPTVYNYLSYRIIDVSSFYGMVERWSTPETWTKKERYIENIMKEKYQSNSNGCEAHRVMYDIERSMEMLKLFTTCFTTF